MIHNGPLSEHPYNTYSLAGIRPIYDSFLEEERFVWSPCEYPMLGILKETEKAKLIQLTEDLAVWIPKKVIHHTTRKDLLCWLPLKGYHFGGPNDEFFVKLKEEVNPMQLIKIGDLVYAPNFSHRVLPVLKSPDSEHLHVIFDLPNGNTQSIYFDKYGKVKGQLHPVVFLATENNKQKAEAFYNIVLEEVPENQSLTAFETLLERFRIEAITAFDYGYEDLSDLENMRNQLIQMFKDRL